MPDALPCPMHPARKVLFRSRSRRPARFCAIYRLPASSTVSVIRASSIGNWHLCRLKDLIRMRRIGGPDESAAYHQIQTTDQQRPTNKQASRQRFITQHVP